MHIKLDMAFSELLTAWQIAAVTKSTTSGQFVDYNGVGVAW
jgi:hypothetical protein